MPDIFVSPPDRQPPSEREEEKENLPASSLSALMVKPKRVSFQSQEKGEEIILLLRKHWVTNTPWIFIGFLMLLGPLAASLFVGIFNLPFQISTAAIFIGIAFWYFLSFGYLFTNFLIWYFNAHLVTNERLVDIDFHSLTYKEVSATRIELVQDVTFKMGGVIQQFFNYGGVYIQTAGTEPNFDFLAVPNPAFVARKIGELMEQVRGEQL